jgi:membrane fusion protein, multidrug efflux system
MFVQARHSCRTLARKPLAATVPVLICVCALASACQKTAAAPSRSRGGAALPVRTTAIQKMSVQRQVDLAGTLLSPDQAKVSSEAAGVVREVLVEIGRQVRVGDPLVRLEPKELALATERAEASLRQTRAQLGMHGPLDETDQPPPDEQIASVRTATATRDDSAASFERAKALRARGILSAVDLQAAETKFKVADAAYQAALDSVRGTKAMLQDRRAAYLLAQKQLADAVVRAPIAGSVTERLVQTGEYISAHTPVATIVQLTPLKLRTGVQERHAGVVTVGQAVEFRVESFADRVFTGKIAYVSPALEQTMRTFTVEALVDNPDRVLKPGFFAKGVIFTRRDDNVMSVPDSAVSTLAGVSSVYVIRDQKITQQTVTLGVRQGNLWEIVDGLKGNETLAASRLNELATGVSVTGAEGSEGDAGRRGGGRRGAGGGRGGKGGNGAQGGGAQ